VRNVLLSATNAAAFEHLFRDISFGVSRLLVSALLAEQAIKTNSEKDVEIFNLWVSQTQLYAPDRNLSTKLMRDIALDVDSQGRL